jgi:hypothetical protein
MQEQRHSQPADIAGAAEQPQEDQIGFSARGRARRRVRFLRKARELAYRDLGGLVFNLHRFGQRNDPLVVAKLSMLDRIDTELRALEHALGQRQPVTVLREAGITACPRCAAIHGSEDRFCPNCGLPVGPHADLPIAGAAGAPANGPGAAQPNVAQAPEPPSQPQQQAGAAPAAAAQGPSPTSAPAAAPAPVASPQRASSQGRSPSPPASAPAPTPPGQDEPTEILRPPTVSQ